jgi:hypothetical protein
MNAGRRGLRSNLTRRRIGRRECWAAAPSAGDDHGEPRDHGRRAAGGRRIGDHDDTSGRPALKEGEAAIAVVVVPTSSTIAWWDNTRQDGFASDSAPSPVSSRAWTARRGARARAAGPWRPARYRSPWTRCRALPSGERVEIRSDRDLGDAEELAPAAPLSANPRSSTMDRTARAGPPRADGELASVMRSSSILCP